MSADLTVSDVSVSNVTVTGVLFRSGTVTLQPGVDTSISWDAFPHAALGLVLSGNGGPAPNAFFSNLSASGATLNAGSNYAVTVTWLAFGN